MKAFVSIDCLYEKISCYSLEILAELNSDLLRSKRDNMNISETFSLGSPKPHERIFPPTFNGLNLSTNTPLNFEIELSNTSEREFYFRFEKLFHPEEILKKNSKDWKFKPLNLNQKVDSLKSLVLIIRSQFTEYRRSFHDLKNVTSYYESLDQRNQQKETIIEKLKNKKMFIKYWDSRRSKNSRDCFMKINKKGLYFYQQFWCFQQFVGFVSFESITKFFFLKQHIVIHSR